MFRKLVDNKKHIIISYRNQSYFNLGSYLDLLMIGFIFKSMVFQFVSFLLLVITKRIKFLITQMIDFVNLIKHWLFNILVKVHICIKILNQAILKFILN